jgi:hypothetical protein
MSDPSRLYIVDSQTGALLSDAAVPQVDAGFYGWAGIFVRSDRSLVVLALGTTAGLLHVEPDGGVSVIKAVPTLYSVLLGGAAIDAQRDRIYVAGGDATQTGRLFTLDAVTGDTIASPPSDCCISLHPRSDGALFGIGGSLPDGGGGQFLRVDPMTGIASLVSSIPGLDGFGSVATTDEISDVAYFFADSGGHTMSRLVSIDLRDGGVIAQPVLVDPYSWSGGLHLYR